MPLPDAPNIEKRARTSWPRVKTGCGICRQRRVKCDEAKPSCGGCVRSGWKCDGYPSPGPVQGRSIVPTSSQTALNITSYAIPFRIPGSKKDREMLHYFCVQGAPEISGFVPSPFWTRTVLQASQHDPAMRQILVALSSLHLDYISSESPGPSVATTATIQLYGKGLRMLRNRLEMPSPESVGIALMCSIVIYCFESIVGNSEAALQQLHRGLSLLASKNDNGLAGLPNSECIAGFYARLDMQATLFDDSNLPLLTLTTAEDRRDGFIGHPDVTFSSLQEAQDMLVKLQNWLAHLLVNNVCYKQKPVDFIPDTVLQDKQQLEQQFQLWHQRFAHFFVDQDTKADDFNFGGPLLLIQYRISSMLLAENLPNNKGVFGACSNPLAEEVVQLAEAVVQQIQARNAAMAMTQPRRNFSCQTGIVFPLALLIVKCVDLSIVQRATHILAYSRRQEGLFDSTAILNVAQHLGEMRVMREHDVILENAPLALEHWTWDIMDGAPAGMDAAGMLIPPTILPTPGSIHNHIIE